MPAKPKNRVLVRSMITFTDGRRALVKWSASTEGMDENAAVGFGFDLGQKLGRQLQKMAAEKPAEVPPTA